jgi:dephospho-CoA kinase
MIMVGLTGSIGMGKSTVAAMFAELGAAVWDADEAVRRLYAPGGAAVTAIALLAPQAIVDGGVDRARLAERIIAEPDLLARIEAVVHPLVGADRARFLEAARARGEDVAILDIPLLYETGAEDSFDAVIVVSAPAPVQQARVMARPGMTAEKFARILARQMPDEEKRSRADYVIDTGTSLDETRRAAARVFDALRVRARA